MNETSARTLDNVRKINENCRTENYDLKEIHLKDFSKNIPTTKSFDHVKKSKHNIFSCLYL